MKIKEKFNSRRSAVLALSIMIIGAVLVVFHSVSSFSFINVDDAWHIYENPHILHFDLKSFLFFWKEPYAALYIPVTYNVWGALSAISRATTGSMADFVIDGRIYHVFNLILHIGNVLISAFIFHQVVKSRSSDASYALGLGWLGSVAIGALFFGIHPIQVEAVAWVSALKDLLMAFFGLSALALILSIPPSSSVGIKVWLHQNSFKLLSAFVLFNFSILSKPSGVVFALLCPLVLLLSYRKLSITYLFYFIAWFFAAGLHVWHTQEVQQPFEGIPIIARIFVAADAVVFYLSKVFMIGQFGYDYGRTPISVFQEQVNFYLVIGMVAGIAAVWLFRLKTVLLVLVCIIGGCLPNSGLVPFVFQQFSTVADRYFYLSMFALSLGVVLLLEKYKSFGLRLGGAGIALALGVFSHDQVQYWKNSESIASKSLSVNARSVMANEALGNALAGKGDFKGALSAYETSATVAPHLFDHGQHFVMALLLDKLGRKAQAIFHLEEAVNNNLESVEYRLTLAEKYLDEKKVSLAVKQLEEIVRLNPQSAEQLYRAGEVAIRSGKLEVAQELLRSSFALDPSLQADIDKLLSANNLPSNF